MNILVVGGTSDDRTKLTNLYGSYSKIPVIVSSLNAPIYEMLYKFIGSSTRTNVSYGANFVGDGVKYELSQEGNEFVETTVKSLIALSSKTSNNPYESMLLKSVNYMNDYRFKVLNVITDINYIRQLELVLDTDLGKKSEYLWKDKDANELLLRSAYNGSSFSDYYERPSSDAPKEELKNSNFKIVILESDKNDLFKDSDILENLKDRTDTVTIDVSKSEEDLIADVLELIKVLEKPEKKEENETNAEKAEEATETRGATVESAAGARPRSIFDIDGA